ncbi:hypothetical protein DENIS_4629 [Desulfonema ishimotonii]|uniref:Antirepressor protein ant N-terminal domain-containing protein n=1 Tax=Desulfonema ishimotonii TaxID=45657 RepID=A0A401G379_9BACT|nr:phage antirepressor N-terminal domain-containing protein [Desulfonema ishimotonii]GBC63631.1 hypothetical protein DENIS_4629 [Desulfonema ishimotonii]
MTKNSIPQVRPENQPVPVDFHGTSLLTAQKNEIVYVAMKPIVEDMGLDWSRQRKKISTSSRYGHMAIPLQTPGGIQEMLCIPLRKLNGWLFSVNPNKVRQAIRKKVELYQEECFIALYEYWHKGIAVNPRKNTAPRIIRYQNYPPIFIQDNALYADTHHLHTCLQPREPYDEWLDKHFRRYLTYHSFPLCPEQPDDPARIAYLILLSQAKSVSRHHITQQGAETLEYFSRFEQNFTEVALDTGLKNAIADAFSGKEVSHQR